MSSADSSVPAEADPSGGATASSRGMGFAAYREELSQVHLPPATRSGAIMGVIIQNLFLFLDYYAFPELFAQFFAVRMVINVGLVASYLGRHRYPHAAMMGVGYSLSIGMLALIFANGATTLPYYTGLVLVLFGIGVMLPLSGVQAALLAGSMTAMFVVGSLLTGAASDQSYGLATFFVVGAAVESVFCSTFLDRMRFREYLQRIEIERARDELAVLDDAKTRFTANVHHELRTPLTLMLAPLEGMRSGDYGVVDPMAKRPLRTMHVNGKRLLKLINNLLDLAKLESQQFQIRRAPLEMADLIDTMIEGAAPMAESKRIRLFAETPGAVPSVHADGEALDKVLVNLVGNALKFTDAGGEIGIGAKGVEGGIEVWVRDTGVGLDANQLERVFDRFAQVDSSATRVHEGTGIGLSLSTELVELHGGRIWAESEGIGHGSTMHFFLPYGESDAMADEAVVATEGDGEVALSSSMHAVEAELGLSTGGKELDEEARLAELERSASKWEQRQEEARPENEVSSELAPILVVDDNADMRELISFILGREFSVHTARNGLEALEVLDGLEPDLVVSDIMMPEMSGTELCKALKEDPARSHIPVMLVSSKAESEMKIEGLELGADDYVTKPFHPRELLARARSHATLHRVRADLAERNVELERTLHELEVAEEQLVQSERLAAVGELAAGIAHEVNNPVNFALNATLALKGVARELGELARDTAALDWDDIDKLASAGRTLRDRIQEVGVEELGAELEELTGIVSGGLERTTRLVGDLRDFAAPGSGARIRFDLWEGLDSTVHLLQHEFGVQNVEVEINAKDGLRPIHGDPGAINQVLLNLLKNAAEAMEGAGGTIRVDLSEDAGEVVVAVRDTGTGIEPEVFEHLFDPFFTTKEAGRGTGLGLSMCRKIAGAHGGRIEVDTEVGQGSTFTLTLPLAPPVDHAPETAAAGSPRA